MDPKFLRELGAIVGSSYLITDGDQLLTYECDALVHQKEMPGAVVLPGSAAEVQAIVRLCRQWKVPFVARGNGTGLSGGATPVEHGIVITLTRFNRIIDVDLPNRRVVVEPGVTNLAISQRVAPDGYYYAPDPSSQAACSIGGNVAENSGGAHCLKYGFTVHHVVAVEMVMPTGEMATFGAPTVDEPVPDMLGIIVGSEGTLGIVTRITVRILRRPEAVKTVLAAFDTIGAAGTAVSGMIAQGIVPAAVEMMDRLAVRAAEAAVHPNFPVAEAILIVELDGPRIEVEDLMGDVMGICRTCGATQIDLAADDEQRARIWKGRKAAFAAMGRISPNYYVQDGVVPRTRLPEVLSRIKALEARSGLPIGNVFHAGDGNLHPLICYDERIEGQAEHAAEVANEILLYCLEAGGSITGEHGVGADKRCSMAKMFSPADLRLMERLRDAIDPDHLCNPGKVFPTPRLCGEVPGPYRPHRIEVEGLGARL
jgi:glycolate oxidase